MSSTTGNKASIKCVITELGKQIWYLSTVFGAQECM